MNSLFTNPGILWALLGIAVPIWLHFYQRKSTTTFYFSDLRGLSLQNELSKGRNEWKKLLLLLIRILALICLILSFSKPKWNFFSEEKNQQGNAIYYLDNHPGLILGNRKRFLALQDKMVASSSNSIHFFHNDFQSADFEPITSSDWKSNWSKILPSIHQQTNESIINRGNELNEDHSAPFILISDFPKNKDLPPLKGKRHYKILPISRQVEENVIVDSVWIDEGFIQAREKFKLKVRLKSNLVESSEKAYSIRFYLNNFLLSNQGFSFSKSRFCELNFELSLPSSGEFSAYFIVDDEVSFDNKFHFVVRTSKTQKVYFVGKNAPPTIRRVFQSDSLFDFESITKEKWLSLKNTSKAFTILHGLENYTNSEWQMVHRRLLEGQSMILIPDPNKNHQALSYLNQLVSSTGRRIELNNENASLSVVQPDLKQVFFDKIIQANSIREKMKTWSSFDTWNFPKSKNSILFTTKGFSYLEKIKVGKGLFFVFSSNILEDRNTFLGHGLFLPVFHELVLQNCFSDKLALEYSKEAFQVFPNNHFLMKDPEKSIVKLKNRNGEFVPEQEWVGDHWNCRLPTSLEAGEVFNGIYSVYSGKEKLGLLAFNFSKKESEIDAYSAADLKTYYSNNSNVSIIDTSEAFDFQSDQIQKWTSSKVLLLIAFLLFLTEMLLLYYYKIKV